MKSEELKHLRQSLGVTQEWLAERLGITRQTVARWEGGEVNVPAYIDLALGQLLRSKAAFPEYVQSVMKAENLTHVKIAERAKKRGHQISPGYVNSVIQGHVTSPKVATLQALAAGMGRPEHEVFRAAGVNTGQTWSDIEVSRFAEMARNYAALPARERESLEAFIAALELAIKTAADR